MSKLFGRAAGAILTLAWLRLALHQSQQPEVLGLWSPVYACFLAVAALVAAGGSWLLRPGALAALRWPAVVGMGLSAGLSLLTAEAAVRGLDLLGASYYEETARYLLDTEPDPLLGYRHSPGRQTLYQEVSVDFNERGMRDRPFDDRAGKRVLLLGDSVTFGWGVEVQDTFGRRLEDWLGGGRTLNTGVCGYNTVQQQRYLEAEGFSLQPDAVILLYVENDIQPPIEIRRDGPMIALRESPSVLFDRLLGASWTYRLVHHLGATVVGPEADPVAVEQARKDSFEALSGIWESCRRRRIPFAVFFYRLRTTSSSDLLWGDLARLALADGFTLVDTAPWFEGRELPELVNSFVDSHPNAEAHEILARGMASSLQRGQRASR